MRFYAAILTGVLAFVGCLAFLWACTDMPLADIVFCATGCYCAGITVFMYITEPAPEKERKFQIYNLKEGQDEK